MKKIKFLGALIVMLFISTSVFGQTIGTYIYVQDIPELPTSNVSEGVLAPADVRVEWLGSDGRIVESPTIYTCVGELARGVDVLIGAGKITAGFFPVVETTVIVGYSYEKHVGVYPGQATSLIRVLHPNYWTLYY